jgi:hypothetical protein
MGTTLLAIIGSILVFLLGLLLYLLKQTRADIDHLEDHLQTALDLAKKEIVDRVQKPDCIREMKEIRDDVKEVVKDIRALEKLRATYGN